MTLTRVELSGIDGSTGSITTASINNIKNSASASNNLVLNSDGTTTLTPSNIIKSGTAQASTSGAAIDFISIPSWVKRITVMFSGVSTNGTSDFGIQLGTGTTPTYTTSGYAGRVSNTASGTQSPTSYAQVLYTADAAYLNSGSVTIQNISSNIWIISGVVATSTAAFVSMCGYTVNIGATLTAVRIKTGNGTDTFDAGTINILYEG